MFIVLIGMMLVGLCLFYLFGCDGLLFLWLSYLNDKYLFNCVLVIFIIIGVLIGFMFLFVFLV